MHHGCTQVYIHGRPHIIRGTDVRTPRDVTKGERQNSIDLALGKVKINKRSNKGGSRLTPTLELFGYCSPPCDPTAPTIEPNTQTESFHSQETIQNTTSPNIASYLACC